MADQQRFLLETRSIAAMEATAEWLSCTRWRMVQGRLCCDATLHVHGHAYAVRLTYPEHFPDLAPAVKPLGDERRWSFHQYGAGGVLCLEWGPDNWHPSLTGVDLLCSTYRLLALENPLGDTEVVGVDAPSRHEESLGQALRSADLRGFLSNRMASLLGGLTLREPLPLRGVIVPPDKVLIVTTAGAWQDPTVPDRIDAEDACAFPGFAFRTSIPGHLFRGVPKMQDLVGLLKDAGVSHWPHNPERPLEDTAVLALAILIDAEDGIHGYLVRGDADREQVRRVALLPDNLGEARQEHGAELSATVGIVGLGSLGSKVALSLARAGVGIFRLVDDDVLLPGNLVRHALDWRSVGRHKVDAVGQAIEGIVPDAVVATHALQLAGQESSQRHAEIIGLLGKCDLIIDATADGQVFNLLSMVSTRSHVPLVWGQTYGGGLGGLVARSRPGIDPTPLQMRAMYQEFCRKHPHEEELWAAEPYSAGTAGEAPLLATDADVGVMANHVVQLALDVITRPQDSHYPYSMYLLGFRAGWVFDQPFQTLPVAMPAADQWPAPHAEEEELSAEEQAELIGRYQAILEDSKG
ncbi:ThiF family adenylyltransferase [Deinococcus marmoris]|uniref:ThiF family adenylyltransferase n=1 Tax=Deinococcus marmoris TaxID=249408 RepID=UPI0004950DDB|nr:ThiF family adenylyltransferase [Deinococcus marmoris]